MTKKIYVLASGGYVHFRPDEVQAISGLRPGGMGAAWFNVTLSNGRTYQLEYGDHRQLMLDVFGSTRPDPA